MEVNEFCAYLNTLSEEDLLELLRQQEVNGIPCDSESCPISVLAYKVVRPVVDDFSTDSGAWHWMIGDEGYECKQSYVVSSFIDAFDEGDLPEFDVTLDSEESLDDEPFPEEDRWTTGDRDA